MSQLRARFRRGGRASLGPLAVTFRPQGRSVKHSDDVPNGLRLRHLQRLLVLFPELERLVPKTLDNDPRAVTRSLELCNALIPLLDEAARETEARSVVADLLTKVVDSEWRAGLELELAASNLRSGVPDRAVCLLELDAPDEKLALLQDELRVALAEYDRHYEARAGFLANSETWGALEGDARGRSLVLVFSQYLDELRDAHVIHVSRESDLSEWLLARRESLGLEYETLDPFDPRADLREDLTSLTLPSESVDWVVCHRVLEHILDDRAAIGEIYRILRPGGFLSVSVPISMQMAETNEWIVPDRSHYDHVRQYGRDFERRLEEPGFEVQVERLLLDMSFEQHVEAQTFPMRIYLCRKPAQT